MENKGITLVALVVTIIIMIILATTSVNLILGPDGIIAKSRSGRDEHVKATENDQNFISESEGGINDLADEIGLNEYKTYGD